jgi:ketosteroid isomerase-like protein
MGLAGPMSSPRRTTIRWVEEGYDRFEDARKVVERLYELGQESADLDPERDQDRFDALIKEATAHFSEDVELVTRDGTLHGPERFFSDWEVQTKDFRLRFEQLRFLDAGDGTVVVVSKMVRTAREGGDYVTSWPATVYRVRGGKVVFFEGYPDAHKACSDLGLDPSLARQR